MHNGATPQAVSDVIKHYVHALWDSPARAQTVPPVMIWGPPGVGKSALVRRAAEDLGIGLIDIRLAQREPVDMRGLPVPDGDQVRWLIASEWPRDPDSRGIIFFDELTAADRTLQASAYELILDRRLGDLYRVPTGWYIVAAGNRIGDHAVANTMSSALANRFCHFELEVDASEWVRWAQGAGVHPAVIGFIKWRPDLLFQLTEDNQRGWASPRSWERVGLVLELAGRSARSADMNFLSIQIAGLIGQGLAIEFLAFLRLAQSVPAAEDILFRNATLEFPARADQRFALTSALVHALLAAGTKLERVWPRFLEVTGAMTSDFAAMAVGEVLDALEMDAVAALLSSPAMHRWNERHGFALAQRHLVPTSGPEPLLDLDKLISEEV